MDKVFVLSFVLALCPAAHPAPSNQIMRYNIHNILEESLTNNTYALFQLSELFFPREGNPPVCTPIEYRITCMDQGTFNTSYLWTIYDSQSPVGQILLSSAFYGIILKGFDWEQTCYFFSDTPPTVLELEALELDCYNADKNETLLEEMRRFTVVLKDYAGTGGPLKGNDVGSNRGYVLKWEEGEKEDRLFRNSFIIFTILLVVLDCFIFFFSLGICSTVYDQIYKRVKMKKNPYYPLFWSFVMLTVVWDVGPSWFILTSHMAHVKYLLGIMVAIQFVLALFMRKYADFPIPGMNWKRVSWDRHRPSLVTDEESVNSAVLASAAARHGNEPKYFFWEICHLRARIRIVASFIVQTIALWALLILFTLVAHYMITISISLYIYPIQTLIKVVFVKAVVVCAMFDVALLFSASMWKCSCSKEANMKNLVTVAQACAAISFLPILAFLTFVIGGVLFSDSVNQLSGIQGILAILPSVVLLLVGWYSKGTLFPEELLPNDPLPPASDSKKTTVQKTDKTPSDSFHTPLLADKVKAAMEGSSTSYGTTDRHSTKADPDLSTSGSRAV